MPKRQLIEHFNVFLSVPTISTAVEAAVRRALSGDKFRSRLQAAVRLLISRSPTLRQVRVTVSR
jgi:hypothetical protein